MKISATSINTIGQDQSKGIKKPQSAQEKDVLSLQKIYFRKYSEFMNYFPDGCRDELAFESFNSWFDRTFLNKKGSVL